MKQTFDAAANIAPNAAPNIAANIAANAMGMEVKR